MSATGSERIKTHRQAQLKKGLVEVRVWVPKGKGVQVKLLADELRSEISV